MYSERPGGKEGKQFEKKHNTISYYSSSIVKTHFTNKSQASGTYIYSAFHMEELLFSTVIVTQLPKDLST